VTALPAYKALAAAKQRVKEFSEERLRLAREEARLQRLMHACKSVALAANLPRVAPAEISSRYEQLVAMEEGALVADPASGTLSQSASTATQDSREE
jgi:hypothetical protein